MKIAFASQSRMGQPSGVCGNFGRCRKADAWESIAGVTACPECGRPLTLSGGVAQKRGGGGAKYVLLSLVAAMLCLGGVFAYLIWPQTQMARNSSGGENPPVKPPVVPTPKPPDPVPEPVPEPVPPPTPPVVQKPKPVEVLLPAEFHAATLRARLLSTISTKTSVEGQSFTARVEGGTYNGAILSGHITKIERKKQAKIGFQFETVTLRGKAIPIQAELTEVANARGAKGVDEENRVIGSTSKKKAFLLGAVTGAVGGIWGAIKGGKKGAAVGAAPGAGAGVILGLTVVSQGNEIHFVPGTMFTLDAKEGREK